MILLTGASGRTGKQILSALVKRDQLVRAFIRDEKKSAAVKNMGARDVMVGDLESTESIEAAVQGCRALIHVGPPMHPQEIKITKALLQAALESSVERFVYYSVMHPLRRDVRHHRLKLDAEEQVIESGLPYTIVQPIRYMQHLDPIWSKVINDGVHAMPFNVDVKFNVVDLADLAEATAVVATNPFHDYATYELAGPESLSQTDMATIISEVLGKEVRAECVPISAMEHKARSGGASDDRVEQMRAMNEHYDQYGFLGNPNVLQWILRRPPTSFRQYVERLAQTNG